ncbi:protein FAM200C-like [Oratosquilla oratoria]|uniref:protein FAM200C-like n=1 Tax=Oratosquilla oratoria TaxID=337810 RepID=UPI003F76C924
MGLRMIGAQPCTPEGTCHSPAAEAQHVFTICGTLLASWHATGTKCARLGIRYRNDATVSEEFPTVLPLSGRTTGKDMYDVLMKFFTSEKMYFSKLVSIVTDGAPSMVASHSELTVHAEIRWLSRGRALARVWGVLEEVESFLIEDKSDNVFPDIFTDEFKLTFVVLVDLFHHLNV